MQGPSLQVRHMCRKLYAGPVSQAKSPASSETFCTYTDVVERFLYETLKAMQGEVVQCRAVLDITDANNFFFCFFESILLWCRAMPYGLHYMQF